MLWSCIRGGLYRVALHQSALYNRILWDISHNVLSSCHSLGKTFGRQVYNMDSENSDP